MSSLPTLSTLNKFGSANNKDQLPTSSSSNKFGLITHRDQVPIPVLKRQSNEPIQEPIILLAREGSVKDLINKIEVKKLEPQIDHNEIPLKSLSSDSLTSSITPEKPIIKLKKDNRFIKNLQKYIK